MAFAVIASPWAGSGYKGRLIAEVDDLPAFHSGTDAASITVRWHAEFTVATTDYNNTLRTWGSWPDQTGSAAIGTRVKKAWNIRVSTKSINPTFGNPYGMHVRGTLTLVENIGSSTVLSIDQWIEIPPKPYANPLAPLNFTVAPSGAAGAALTWSANYTSATGATPWTELHIDRRNGGGDWARAATLPWSATSWTDTGLPDAGEFTYRIRSSNSSGTSPWAESPTVIQTTPPKPAWVTTDRDASGGIVLEWESSGSKWEVWHSLNGVWETSPISVRTVKNYTHASPAAGVHRYAIYTVTAGGAKSEPVYTLDIAGSAAPAAPTSLAPTGSSIPRELALPLVWRHVPIDGTKQTAYEVQYRISTNAGSTWGAWTSTGKITSTGMHVFAALLFAAGALVEWQVRTWGKHADPSPWSATASFTARTRPTATITSPSGASMPTDQVTLTWTTTLASGATQTAYSATLKDADGEILEARTGTTAQTLTFAKRVTSGAQYTVTLVITDSYGLTSTTVTRTFTATFTPPPQPAVTLSQLSDIGQVVVSIDNTTTLTPAPVHNRIYRNGVLVADLVPLNTTWTDRLAIIGESTYRVEAVAPTGVASASEASANLRGGWFFVNYGEGFTGYARARYNPSISSSFERTAERHEFVGNTRPVTYFGPIRHRSVSVAAVIEESDQHGNRDAWIRAVDAGGMACYRDPLGRLVYGSMTKVNFGDETDDTTNLSFTFEEDQHVG